MERLQHALTGLEDDDLLSPSSTVESLQRLERIAHAAMEAELPWDSLLILAQWVMDQHWVTEKMPGSFLASRRAEVLLRLSTMFEEIQGRRRAEEVPTTWRGRMNLRNG